MPITSSTTRQRTRPWAAIAAVTVLTLPLGSIYAFSVFLRPIETELGIPRAALSFVFGLATVGFHGGNEPRADAVWPRLTGGPDHGKRGDRRAGDRTGIICRGLPMLLLGYSMVFGISGGTIFIILQQAVNILVRTGSVC